MVATGASPWIVPKLCFSVPTGRHVSVPQGSCRPFGTQRAASFNSTGSRPWLQHAVPLGLNRIRSMRCCSATQVPCVPMTCGSTAGYRTPLLRSESQIAFVREDILSNRCRSVLPRKFDALRSNPECLEAAIPIPWTFMSEILASDRRIFERLSSNNNVRFGSVSWPSDGHECPSYLRLFWRAACVSLPVHGDSNSLNGRNRNVPMG